MFAVKEMSRATQRTLCMLVSAVIVVAGLGLGVIGAEVPLHQGYSVTVTQLQ